MKRFAAIILVCSIFIFSACELRTVYRGEVPTLKFEKIKYDIATGKPCYYLFDDNPEYLTEEFLADGNKPSSIAHFGDLNAGIYTVFSYHHRGTAADSNTDLFFDVLFRCDNAVFKITKIGLDHDWQWNKAWADYSGTDVYMPEFLNTSECICEDNACAEDDGICDGVWCKCAETDKLVEAEDDRYEGVGTICRYDGDILLSDIIPTIKEEKVNQIRHGGKVEPIWLMMEFEIIDGSMSADTIAYKNYDLAQKMLGVMEYGRFVNEPQYKGIADNAPVVSTEIGYVFDDTTGKGPLPVRIVNQRFPDGYISKNGKFGTYVNTWKRANVLLSESTESDMISLKYEDDSKLTLYGAEVTEKDNVWIFDPFHTRLYTDVGDIDFVPNINMSNIPKGKKKTDDEFYSKYVCNLGNFGVRYLYKINLQNNSDEEKIFTFSLNSVSGHIYRYSLSNDHGIIKDDGNRYIMKKFDMQPKEGQAPSRYTTSEDFVLKPGGDYVLMFETVVLTGCDSPLEITFAVR